MSRQQVFSLIQLFFCKERRVYCRPLVIGHLFSEWNIMLQHLHAQNKVSYRGCRISLDLQMWDQIWSAYSKSRLKNNSSPTPQKNQIVKDLHYKEHCTAFHRILLLDISRPCYLATLCFPCHMKFLEPVYQSRNFAKQAIVHQNTREKFQK